MTQQQRNMQRSALALAIIGIIFAFSGLAVLHPIAHIFLALAYWPMQSVPTDFGVPLPLLLAITGGLTVGLAGMLYASSVHVAPLSARAAQQVVRTAAWSWFVIDSAASVVVGAPFNVILNTSFLGLMLWSARPLEAHSQAA